MITILQFAVQTIFGWAVITCGVPAEEVQAQLFQEFRQVSYYCAIEVDGQQFGTAGAIFRRDEGTGLDDLRDRFGQGDYQ